jgi:hypothetical protein
LAESYDWFTEGFDTADLREAKTLLALSRQWIRTGASFCWRKLPREEADGSRR